MLISSRYVLRIPLRYSEEQLIIGDGEVHGELPYAFFHEGARDYDPEYGRSHPSQSQSGAILGVNPETGNDKATSSDEGSQKGVKQA